VGSKQSSYPDRLFVTGRGGSLDPPRDSFQSSVRQLEPNRKL
jgi:hypothetical protein